MLSRNNSDFIVGSNGHAGLSNRKTAELLMVHPSSVDDALKTAGLYTPEETEFIVQYGFQGAGLVKLATRFAKSDKLTLSVLKERRFFVHRSNLP